MQNLRQGKECGRARRYGHCCFYLLNRKKKIIVVCNFFARVMVTLCFQKMLSCCEKSKFMEVINVKNRLRTTCMEREGRERANSKGDKANTIIYQRLTDHQSKLTQIAFSVSHRNSVWLKSFDWTFYFILTFQVKQNNRTTKITDL